MPMTTPPCIWPEISSGTMGVPHSSQVLCDSTRTSPEPEPSELYTDVYLEAAQ